MVADEPRRKFPARDRLPSTEAINKRLLKVCSLSFPLDTTKPEFFHSLVMTLVNISSETFVEKERQWDALIALLQGLTIALVDNSLEFVTSAAVGIIVKDVFPCAFLFKTDGKRSYCNQRLRKLYEDFRFYVIVVLDALARFYPKALLEHWEYILPKYKAEVDSPFGRHLFSIVLHDDYIRAKLAAFNCIHSLFQHSHDFLDNLFKVYLVTPRTATHKNLSYTSRMDKYRSVLLCTHYGLRKFLEKHEDYSDLHGALCRVWQQIVISTPYNAMPEALTVLLSFLSGNFYCSIISSRSAQLQGDAAQVLRNVFLRKYPSDKILLFLSSWSGHRIVYELIHICHKDDDRFEESLKVLYAMYTTYPSILCSSYISDLLSAFKHGASSPSKRNRYATLLGLSRLAHIWRSRQPRFQLDTEETWLVSFFISLCHALETPSLKSCLENPFTSHDDPSREKSTFTSLSPLSNSSSLDFACNDQRDLFAGTYLHDFLCCVLFLILAKDNDISTCKLGLHTLASICCALSDLDSSIWQQLKIFTESCQNSELSIPLVYFAGALVDAITTSNEAFGAECDAFLSLFERILKTIIWSNIDLEYRPLASILCGLFVMKSDLLYNIPLQRFLGSAWNFLIKFSSTAQKSNVCVYAFRTCSICLLLSLEPKFAVDTIENVCSKEHRQKWATIFSNGLSSGNKTMINEVCASIFLWHEASKHHSRKYFAEYLERILHHAESISHDGDRTISLSIYQKLVQIAVKNSINEDVHSASVPLYTLYRLHYPVGSESLFSEVSGHRAHHVLPKSVISSCLLELVSATLDCYYSIQESATISLDLLKNSFANPDSNPFLEYTKMVYSWPEKNQRPSTFECLAVVTLKTLNLLSFHCSSMKLESSYPTFNKVLCSIENLERVKKQLLHHERDILFFDDV